MIGGGFNEGERVKHSQDERLPANRQRNGYADDSVMRRNGRPNQDVDVVPIRWDDGTTGSYWANYIVSDCPRRDGYRGVRRSGY